MIESDSRKHLPGGFIDALLGYAADPTQWESVAAELEKREAQLRNIDPSEFLATLSQAEALAWHLHKSPQLLADDNCAYLLVRADGTLLANGSNTLGLDDCISVEDERVAFFSPRSELNLTSALEQVQSGGARQALVELIGLHASPRLGYLVHVQDAPAGMRLGHSEVRFVLLVAQAEPSDQACQVLQSSFGLTAAETAVCHRLASGLQLKQIATALSISTNTARNHLQSVFEKTGMNRQNDLLLLITQLSVILSVIDRQRNADQPLGQERYPPHQFAIVKSGSRPRRVAYRSYGDGEHTLVYFHETAGTSRLPPGSDQLAAELGLRIIAPERPGTGFSDPIEQYTFDAVATDTLSLLDGLGFERMSFLGYLSGAAHALAAASRLGSRVERVMLVAGRAPLRYEPAEDSPLAVLRRRLFQQPWLLSTFFNILRSRASDETNRRILKRVYGGVPADAALLEAQTGLLDHLVGYTMESLTVSASGLVGEISCFSDPTPVPLQDIESPLSVWHGEDDVLTSPQRLIESLEGLDYELRLFPGWGSLVMYAHWAEVLGHVAERHRRAASVRRP